MNPILLAQIQDGILTAVAQLGIVGPVAAWLMYRDGKRQDAVEARQLRQEQQMERVIGSINHLTRAITLEVTTRPHVVERARSEAQELLADIRK